MICVVCSRAHVPAPAGDVGGTGDLQSISDTGTEEYVFQIEKAIFQRFKEGRRNFHACGRDFWLSRIPELCHGIASPSVVEQLCRARRKPIVVAHVLMRQACLFLPGNLRPKAICLICSLRLCMLRMLVLLVVREDEVFQVIRRGRQPVRLRKTLVGNCIKDAGSS